MSFNNKSNKESQIIDEKDSESKEEYEYEISIYANDKKIFNQIQEIKQIKHPSSISSIQIRLSSLNNLQGLNAFINIIQLDLSNNQITSLNKYLYTLVKLKFLDISCNKLSSLDGIEFLENLEHLNAAHNKLVTLSCFRKFKNKKNLSNLNIKGNLIYDLKEFDNLVGFNSLQILVLSEGNDTNPVCSNENCNDYIFSVLNNNNIQNINDNSYTNINNNDVIDINEQKKLFPKTVRNDINANNNNIISDINHKHFFNKTLAAQFTNMGLYKDEMKNLQYNLQDIYRDQKKLIFKYEKDINEWESKAEDLQHEIDKLSTENKTLKNKIETLENNYKEIKYKNDDLIRENRELNQNYHTKELEINELSIKLAHSQKEYELLQIDKNKYSQINKDYNTEINRLKNDIRALNSNSDRMENSYKDIISKKSDELNSQMRIASNLETKIYDLTKSITEKQKEIENLSNMNSSLQNNIDLIRI